ncbi:MAG: hypothetical protein KIT09_35835 [Bryobacteraceae bacterium]|nr:hypothetical protein [Bryobacteraceae bacterium]
MKFIINTVIAAFLCVLGAWAQPAPKFPAELPTWSDILRAKNSAVATLTGPIGPDDLSIPVSNGLAFPAPGAVTIEAEHIRICSVAAGSLTVCPGGRGFDGSQKAAHAAGKLVDGRVLARHHEQLGAEVIALAESLGPELQNVVKNGGLATPNAVPVVSAGGTLGELADFGFDSDQRLRVRLRDFVSVKDFGAKGDGTTDDTAAIKAARDYVESRALQIPIPNTGKASLPTLYFPAGQYRITEPNAICPKPESWVGASVSGWSVAGENGSSSLLYLNFPNAPDNYLCKATTLGVSRGTFENLWIYGSNKWERGFYFWGEYIPGVASYAGSSMNTFRKVRFQNLKESVTIDGPGPNEENRQHLLGDRFLFEQVSFRATVDMPDAVGFWMKPPVVQSVAHLMLLPDFEMLGERNVGLYVQGGSTVTMVDPSLVFDGDGTIAIRIDTDNEVDGGGGIGVLGNQFSVFGGKAEIRSTYTATPPRAFYLSARADLNFYDTSFADYDREVDNVVKATIRKWGHVTMRGGKWHLKTRIETDDAVNLQWWKAMLRLDSVGIKRGFEEQIELAHTATSGHRLGAYGRAECNRCYSSYDLVNMSANLAPADACLNCTNGMDNSTRPAKLSVFRFGSYRGEGLPSSGDAGLITLPAGSLLKSFTVVKEDARNCGAGGTSQCGVVTSGVVTVASESGQVLFESPTWNQNSKSVVTVPAAYLCTPADRVFTVSSTAANRLEGYILYEWH